MGEIIKCYANWRIDLILLLGCLALLLATGDGESLAMNAIGVLLAVADVLIARRWRRGGKLKELDRMAE